jgi:sodium/potassium/calcium exchanger 6
VTLLALGNGAPDIVSAIVASGSDIFVAVGGALGTGLFLSTITTGATILVGQKEVQVPPLIILR